MWNGVDVEENPENIELVNLYKKPRKNNYLVLLIP